MRDLQNTSHSFVADLYKFDRSARLICTAWVQLKKLFLNKTPVIYFESFSARMLPKMSEEKATTGPTIIFSQNEVFHPAVSPKSRPYWKYAIIAVTAVVVVAIILTAILVGMHLYTQGQKDIVQFTRTRDDNTKEEVISDPNTNIFQYHLTGPDYETWVIDDFTRDIQTVKSKTDQDTNCYLTPLNRTSEIDPSKVKAPSDIKRRNDSFALTYRASNTPISDISFLSKAARDTCKGISTYWMYPSCEDPNDSPSRKKRAVRAYKCTLYIIDSTGCYVIPAICYVYS